MKIEIKEMFEEAKKIYRIDLSKWLDKVLEKIRRISDG